MRFTVVCGFFLVLGSTGTASAQHNRGQAPSTLDTMSAHLRADLNPHDEQVVIGRHGREDRVFRTRRGYQSSLRYYLDAYRFHRTLKHGVTVAGYFVNETRGYATITLYQNHNKFLLNIHDDRDGARFVLWGKRYLTHKGMVNKYKKKKIKKRPFHRGHPPARVHRYRL